MELLQLDAGQLALLGSIIAGSNELLKRLRAKDFWVAGTIFSSAVLGGLIGAYYKVDFLSGVAAGLATSGAIATLGSIGNKSTPAPSKLIVESKK